MNLWKVDGVVKTEAGLPWNKKVDSVANQ